MDAPSVPLPVSTPASDGGRSARGWWLAFAVLCGATAACWTLRGAPSAVVAVSAVLPLLWLLFLVVAAAGGRRARPVLALASTTWALAWGRAWVPWPDAPKGPPFVVMAWNVQRLGWDDARKRARAIACIAKQVGEAGVGILALEEVSANDVADLGPKLSMTCAQTDYAGTGSEDDGGVAVCARDGQWRIETWQRVRAVPGEEWFHGFAEVARTGSEEEEIDAVVNVLAVHLWPFLRGLREGKAASDVTDLQARAADHLVFLVEEDFRDPTVVAGDFNSPRDSALHAALRRHMTDSWEKAGWGPGATVRLGPLPLRVDYLYAKKIAVAGAAIPDADCSDHRPVVAALSPQD